MNREGKKCVLYPRVSTEMQVDGYSPVSYTHLDVYKRQSSICSVIAMVILLVFFIIGSGYLPVSYTHLDVYKRQPPIL